MTQTRDYIPRSDLALQAWVENFMQKMDIYGALVNVPAPMKAALELKITYFNNAI